jgi:hypothetical protein
MGHCGPTSIANRTAHGTPSLRGSRPATTGTEVIWCFHPVTVFSLLGICHPLKSSYSWMWHICRVCRLSGTLGCPSLCSGCKGLSTQYVINTHLGSGEVSFRQWALCVTQALHGPLVEVKSSRRLLRGSHPVQTGARHPGPSATSPVRPSIGVSSQFASRHRACWWGSSEPLLEQMSSLKHSRGPGSAGIRQEPTPVPSTGAALMGWGSGRLYADACCP